MAHRNDHVILDDVEVNEEGRRYYESTGLPISLTSSSPIIGKVIIVHIHNLSPQIH